MEPPANNNPNREKSRNAENSSALPLSDEAIRTALQQDDLVTPRRSKLAWIGGTFFGIGLIGKGGGSVAAAVTCLLWWAAAAYLIPNPQVLPFTILVAGIATLRGIGWSSVVAREIGKKDPSEVVIDEVAGQFIALLFAPLSWKYVLVAFILFRVFDIFKPPPVRQLEQLPSGLGIMMDDVAAGLYALIILRVVHFYGWL